MYSPQQSGTYAEKQYRMVAASDIRVGDVCRVPGQLSISTVKKIEKNDDRVTLHWVSVDPSTLHVDQPVTFYGHRNFVSTIFHALLNRLH